VESLARGELALVRERFATRSPPPVDRTKPPAYTCTMTQLRTRRLITPKQAGARGGAIDRWLDPRLFKALSDPNRVRLLACLAKCGRACSVGELAECCEVDLSVVSRHLRLLERAGAVAARKQGRVVFYEVRAAALAATLRGLAHELETCGGGSCGTACGCSPGRGGSCAKP
jgi:DNA-binding transcriptional ArsR family regulator